MQTWVFGYSTKLADTWGSHYFQSILFFLSKEDHPFLLSE